MSVRVYNVGELSWRKEPHSLCPDGAGLHCTVPGQSWKEEQDQVQLFKFLAKEEQRSEFCPEGSLCAL